MRKWRGSPSLRVERQDLIRRARWILAQQGPLTIYDVWRKLRSQRDFAYMPYNTVNRRVRALEEHGYIEKVEKEKQRQAL